MLPTSRSPEARSTEDRLDVTELIACLAAERDGVPWPPTSHRLRAPSDRTSSDTGAHRLQDSTATGAHRLRPATEADGTGRRLDRRLAPVLVGVLVVAVVAVTTLLRPAAAPGPGPQPTDAALAAPAPSLVLPTPKAAPSSSAAPAASAAPVTLKPTALAPPSTTASKATTAARPSAASPRIATPSGPAPAGVRPVRPACRGNADAPRPGDVICFTGSLDAPLKISVGGTAAAPVVYSGNGATRVPGITATADNVVIQGFVSDGADSTGIWASGKNVVVQDNTITQVRHTDEDLDAIRFFGDGAKVLHNWVHDLEGSADIGGSHVDCIQTFATSRPGSSNVVIQGNRCEGIRAQCLMAEGPHADTASGKGGGGQGVSRDWLFDGNFCDAHAEAQSVALQDVQNVTISNNVMAGKGNKAFALGQESTGTVVRGNTIGAGYGREVGFDDDSARDGYQGPPAD